MMRHPLFWLLLVALFFAAGSRFDGLNFTPIAMAEKAVR